MRPKKGSFSKENQNIHATKVHNISPANFEFGEIRPQNVQYVQFWVTMREDMFLTNNKKVLIRIAQKI